MTHKFYNEYLGAQISPYVSKGLFIQSTENLSSAAGSTGIISAEYLDSEYTAGATEDVYIVRLEKNVPQRIRMFIWLEGQDTDCVNSASASSFAFRIELAGGHETTDEVEVFADVETEANDEPVNNTTEDDTLTANEAPAEEDAEPESEINNSNSTEIQLEE